MKILLDECVNVRFASHLEEHDVKTVTGMSWRGLKNGELLRRAAETGFQALVTIDQNLPYQQNWRAADLRIVIMRPRSGKLRDLIALKPAVLLALRTDTPDVVYCP